jgi:uncharacterized protein (UPF0332 family)
VRYARSLVATARGLTRRRGRARRSDLNRAVSTAYYALFAAIAFRLTTSLCGTRAAGREASWDGVYRSIGHDALQSMLARHAVGHPVSDRARALSAAFARMKQQRNLADYDPAFRVTRARAEQLVADCEEALHLVEQISAQDWLALAVALLVKTKDRQ